MSENCNLTPTYVFWHVCMPPHMNTQVIRKIKIQMKTVDKDLHSAMIKIKLT